jgi:6-phosphogluconolactonase
MKALVKIFDTPNALAEELAGEFYFHLSRLSKQQDLINIGLSGGSSPQLWFKRIASHRHSHALNINWHKVHFFWCDERCVPEIHPESNYGVAYRLFLKPLAINISNIHRIRGEDNPEEEAIRYAEEILKHVPVRNNIPVFDWIFLGLGDDGHTASIFPDQLNLLYSDKICEVAVHPQTGQKRITLTGKTLINAKRITFIITGTSKSQIVHGILTGKPVSKLYPAKHIKPLRGEPEWYLDKEAAALINKGI